MSASTNIDKRIGYNAALDDVKSMLAKELGVDNA